MQLMCPSNIARLLLISQLLFSLPLALAEQNQGSENDVIQQAQTLIEDEQGQAALDLLLAPGQRGDAEAAYWLGRLYFYDEAGVARDDQQAEYWFSQAAQAGHAAAQYKLGSMYFLGRIGPAAQQDLGNAARWWLAAASQAHAEALNNLGALLATGQGLPTDENLALALQIRAAELGSESAQANLQRKGETSSARQLADSFKTHPATLRAHLQTLEASLR